MSSLWLLTHQAPTPQNGQTHSNNSSATADDLFECIWPFCMVGAYRVKNPVKTMQTLVDLYRYNSWRSIHSSKKP